MRQNTFKRCLLLILVLSLFLVYFVVLPFGHLLFDNHSLRGGELGRMIDTLGRTVIFRRIMQKRTAWLNELGIQLPPMKDVINKKGIPNLPQAAVAEILIRSKIRTRQLQAAETDALQWSSTCGSSNLNATMIPNLVLQPDHGDFFRPVHAPGLEVIRFDHYSMRELVRDVFPTLLGKFDRAVDKTEQTMIWTLCALYFFGGYVFGPNCRTVHEYLGGIVGARGGCDSVGVAVFQQTANSGARAVELLTMASTPRHPRMKRVLERLASDTDEKIDTSIILLGLYEDTILEEKQVGAQSNDQWDVLVCSCSKKTVYNDNTCCETGETGVSDKVSLEDSDNPSPRVYVKVIELGVRSKSRENPNASPAIEVSVTERSGTPTPVKVPKATIRDRLLYLKCNAGWICNRCLKNAIFGSHEACKLVCPACYREVICEESDAVAKKQVHIDVSVREMRVLASDEQRIPRIIHQTWFDEPSVDRYPQLARLQNSWKNQGWEYRFYRDDDVREYIAKYYPPRFLDAFDSVIPGAFKVSIRFAWPSVESRVYPYSFGDFCACHFFSRRQTSFDISFC